MEVILTALASMFKPDERFIMHRFHSTRIAMIVGILLTVVWFNYELVANDTLRWDLAIIVGAMGITKLLAMLYFRIVR
jgi:hypothetical protein